MSTFSVEMTKMLYMIELYEILLYLLMMFDRDIVWMMTLLLHVQCTDGKFQQIKTVSPCW